MSENATPTQLSYWQLGCNDGKAGRGPRRPYPNAGRNYCERRANEGYMAGYRFGCMRRHEPTVNEGSEP